MGRVTAEKKDSEVQTSGPTREGASQVVLVVKNPPANAGDAGNMSSVPGSGRSLKEKMATYSSIPAGKISWTEEPGGYSPWVTKSWTRLIN